MALVLAGGKAQQVEATAQEAEVAVVRAVTAGNITEVAGTTLARRKSMRLPRLQWSAPLHLGEVAVLEAMHLLVARRSDGISTSRDNSRPKSRSSAEMLRSRSPSYAKTQRTLFALSHPVGSLCRLDVCTV